jgi:hypothetical protein
MGNPELKTVSLAAIKRIKVLEGIRVLECMD